MLEEMNGDQYRFDATITVHLWRAGEHERARARMPSTERRWRRTTT